MATRADAAPEPPRPTPRSQVARVVVAATLAAVLGAGPAVAWEASTQLPRGEAPSHWAKPSPWRAAGKHVKAAAGGIARVYLPRSRAAPAATEEPASPSPVASAAGAGGAGPSRPTAAVATAAVLAPEDIE